MHASRAGMHAQHHAKDPFLKKKPRATTKHPGRLHASMLVKRSTKAGTTKPKLASARFAASTGMSSADSSTDLLPCVRAAWDLLNEARCQKCSNGTIAVRSRVITDVQEAGSVNPYT